MRHENSKTAECYTHLNTKGFSVIKSHLDDLELEFLLPKEQDDKIQ